MRSWCKYSLFALFICLLQHSLDYIIAAAPTSNQDGHNSNKQDEAPSPCIPANCPTPTNRKKIAFIHIPKTGGETVEAILKLHKYHQNAYYRCFRDQNNLQNVYKIPCKRDPNEYAFGIVRNPFDRMFSWFHFCIHGYCYDKRSGLLETPGPGPFNGCEMLRNKIKHDKHRFDHSGSDPKTMALQQHSHTNYTKHLFEWYLIETKKFYDGFVFPQGVQSEHFNFSVWSTYDFYFNDYFTNVSLVENVIRFEDIYTHGTNNTCLPFYNAFCNMGIKITLPAMMPHENDNTNGKIIDYKKFLEFLAHKPYHDFYTAKSKHMVASFYANDLKKYHYSFDHKG